MEEFIENSIEEIKREVGDKKPFVPYRVGGFIRSSGIGS